MVTTGGGAVFGNARIVKKGGSVFSLFCVHAQAQVYLVVVLGDFVQPANNMAKMISEYFIRSVYNKDEKHEGSLGFGVRGL